MLSWWNLPNASAGRVWMPARKSRITASGRGRTTGGRGRQPPRPGGVMGRMGVIGRGVGTGRPMGGNAAAKAQHRPAAPRAHNSRVRRYMAGPSGSLVVEFEDDGVPVLGAQGGHRLLDADHVAGGAV